MQTYTSDLSFLILAIISVTNTMVITSKCMSEKTRKTFAIFFQCIVCWNVHLSKHLNQHMNDVTTLFHSSQMLSHNISHVCVCVCITVCVCASISTTSMNISHAFQIPGQVRIYILSFMHVRIRV